MKYKYKHIYSYEELHYVYRKQKIKGGKINIWVK